MITTKQFFYCIWVPYLNKIAVLGRHGLPQCNGAQESQVLCSHHDDKQRQRASRVCSRATPPPAAARFPKPLGTKVVRRQRTGQSQG